MFFLPILVRKHMVWLRWNRLIHPKSVLDYVDPAPLKKKQPTNPCPHPYHTKPNQTTNLNLQKIIKNKDPDPGNT